MLPPFKPLNSILIKPSGPDCNMACTYCFYLEKENLFTETKIHRMSDEILEEMIKQVLEQAGANVSFGWQGGEPTLMGLPFFEKAVAFQQKYGRGQSVGNGLQTNGILIDEKWAKFLDRYNFLVGLSLDGPENIHNHYRFLRGGKGSWQQVTSAAKVMLDAGVAVNALTVVNDYSVQFPEEIYYFHREMGLDFMQFIPCVETDPAHPDRAALFSVAPEKYGEFLCKIFDLWQADFEEGASTTSVRYFDSVFYSYVGLTAPECTLLPACGIYVVVEHNGDVYSCDFFVEPEWKLGNVMEHKIIDMLNSERQHRFGLMKAGLPQKCRTCKWLPYCYGGCTKDRIHDPRDQNLNHFCASYKMFFNHADERMRRLAVDWQRQQEIAAQHDALFRPDEIDYLHAGRNDPCPCGSGLKYKNCCGR
ncbi:MAG TPA: anaerobic sulfatase maturase [Bacteroidetes bacterium]|nr:anaerobic sulfatase maturase [Bacteroidota bacterium]